MIRRLVLLLIAVTVCQNVDVWAADGPAKDVPELQVLSNYVGTWDVAITSKDSPFTKGDPREMVLDGRFVEQTGELKSADGSNVIKITTLMTYDPNGRCIGCGRSFRMDQRARLRKMDEKTRTMTSTSRQDGTTTTTTQSSATTVSKSGCSSPQIKTMKSSAVSAAPIHVENHSTAEGITRRSIRSRIGRILKSFVSGRCRITLVVELNRFVDRDTAQINELGI